MFRPVQRDDDVSDDSSSQTGEVGTKPEYLLPRNDGVQSESTPPDKDNVEKTVNPTQQQASEEDMSYRVPSYFVLSFEWVLFTAIISSSLIFVHVNVLKAPAETLDCITLVLLLSILNFVWCVVCIFIDEDTSSGRFTNGLAAACSQSTATTAFHVLLVFWYGWLGDVRYNPIDSTPVTWHQLYSIVVFVFATVASIVASAASFAAKPIRSTKNPAGFQVTWIFNSYSYSMLATLALTIVQREKLQESRTIGSVPLDTTLTIFYVVAFQFVHMLLQLVKIFFLANSGAIIRAILYGFTFALDLFVWLLAYGQVTQEKSKLTLLILILPALLLQAFTTLYRIVQEFSPDKKGETTASPQETSDTENNKLTLFHTGPVTYTPQTLKKRLPIYPVGPPSTQSNVDRSTEYPYIHTHDASTSLRRVPPSSTAFSMSPSLSYQQNILRKIAPSTFQPQAVPTRRHWPWTDSSDRLYDETHPKYN